MKIVTHSRELAQHIWGNFSPVAFKIILGLFGALAIFAKTDFQNASLLLHLCLFYNKIFICVPV